MKQGDITEDNFKNINDRFELNIKETELSYITITEELFDKFIEPDLIQPTFIYDYPEQTAPLAKTKENDNTICERFELFIDGKEIANAYTEQNNPIIQKEKFIQQAKTNPLIKTKNIEELIDNYYIRALEYGMPPTGGLGIGIDRLVMLLTNSYSIRDVILFPQMKKESKI